MSADNVTVSSDAEFYKDPAELLKLPIHPFADFYPMLPPDRLRALASDIKAPKNGRETGQLHPIIINVVEGESMLVDGRNRLKACEIAGVLAWVKYVAVDEGGVLDLINSFNNQRRQLEHRQLAEAAWRFKAEMLAQGKKLTQDELCLKFGIARRTLNKWRPGGKEVKQADAKKGNNNNKYPIHPTFRKTAHMLSELTMKPRLSQELSAEIKAISVQIKRLYGEVFPNTP
jgi:hypothetical protein